MSRRPLHEQRWARVVGTAVLVPVAALLSLVVWAVLTFPESHALPCGPLHDAPLAVQHAAGLAVFAALCVPPLCCLWRRPRLPPR
jgi:hypothetical protein